MIGVAFSEAIEFLRKRLEIGEDEFQALVREIDEAARVRAAGISRAMNRDILLAVLKSFEEGTTMETFREEFDRLAITHGWKGDNTDGYRSALIFRNLTAQAQAAGRWKQIQRSKERLPYLRYLTVGDHRVRPAHKAWDNLVLRHDDPWWKTHFPPNGFNCRCRVVQIGEHDLERYKLTVGTAPPLNPVIKYVKVDGLLQPVEVPAGIDPGFAYNAGEVGLQIPPLP